LSGILQIEYKELQCNSEKKELQCNSEKKELQCNRKRNKGHKIIYKTLHKNEQKMNNMNTTKSMTILNEQGIHIYHNK
jgi:hypothetical protein